MSDDQQQQDLGLSMTGPVKRVENYKFEPIRGYPMLQWAGKRPFTSTQYYPAQHKETYGTEMDGWRNKIYWGDNLQVMSHLLKQFRGKVQLIYIDPPFDSRADYKRKITIRGENVATDTSTFEEKQYSDIWANDDYLQYMYERLILMKELLADRGSIWVHCDWRKNHYLRCIMDEVFGPDNFVNSITWKRTTAHGDAKQGARHFDVVDDTILFYCKYPNQYTWNTQYAPFSDEQIRQQYNKNENGRLYRLVTPTAAKPGGDTLYEWRGVRPPEGRYWAYTREKLEELDKQGKLYYSSTGQPYIKYYLDERPGVALSTIWNDIMLSPTSLERVDYPTQKPEALLERIITASSNPSDLVLDCFMGSGTTQVVAMKLGRRFLGSDINLGAVQITTKRLLSIAAEIQAREPTLGLEEDAVETYYTGFEVYNVNNYDIFRNPVQAKELLIQALEINPLTAGSLFDGEKDGRMVKIMPINRIATRQDLNELITGFDYRAFEKRQAEHANQAVEKVTLVCMGHEPDLAAHLQHQMSPLKLDIEVVDILRDKQELQFKRDSEAKIAIRDGYLVIEQFYPMNLLAKLSLQQEQVENWRELVDSVMVDWNYDGAVLQPAVIDVPKGNQLVAGGYRVPDDAGTIRVKITDLLSESLERELTHG